MDRPSKNAVFGPNSLLGFWTRPYCPTMPTLTGSGLQCGGPKSGQAPWANLDGLVDGIHRHLQRHKQGKWRLDRSMSIKRRDTVGEPQGFIFQYPKVFPGVDADRLKAQIQAIDPILWHFVVDALDKPLN